MNHKLLKDQWIIGNEEDGCNIWGLSIFPYVFITTAPKFAKTAPWVCVMEFKGEHMRLLVPVGPWEVIANSVFNWQVPHILHT